MATKHDEYDWEAARFKVIREGKCRYCKISRRYANLEAAHTIGRKDQDELQRHATYQPGRPLRVVRWVPPSAIVPLCAGINSNSCHSLYDARKLDILDLITQEEQASAVAAVGIVRAVKRLTSGRFEVREKEDA